MRARPILLAFALAIVLSTVNSPQSASADSPRIVFSIGEGVSDSDETNVREGVVLAVSYLREHYRASLKDDLVVNVRDMESPLGANNLAFADGDYLVVFTGAPAWDYLSPALRLQVIVHEFVHIYQYDQIGGHSDSGPMWIIEGMAEFVSFGMIQSLGVLRSDDVYDAQTWALSKGLDRVPRLSDLEDIVAFQSAAGPVYSLAFLAISQLAGERPVERLTIYLELIAEGKPWQHAFQRAFGLAPSDFYEQFQVWTDEEMLSPSNQPQAFESIIPDGIEADVEIVNTSFSTGPGAQLVVVAQTGPNAECGFVLQDSTGTRIPTVDVIADRTGLVFLLQTIPENTLVGQSTVTVDCGAESDRIEVDIADRVSPESAVMGRSPRLASQANVFSARSFQA